MVKALPHTTFDDIFQMNDAQCTTVFGDYQRGTTASSYLANGFTYLIRHLRPMLGKILRDCINRALANTAAIHFDPAHTCNSRKWYELSIRLRQLTGAKVIFFLREDDDGAALWCLIRQR